VDEAARERRNAYQREYQKAWRAKNKETVSERNRVYREAHLDERRQYRRDHYRENADEYKEYARSYRESHPEVQRAADRRRRALEYAAVSVPFTEEEVLLRWGTRCHICGEEIDLEAPRWNGSVGWERGLHLDHVTPLSKDGEDTLDNVKPSHGLCNNKKRARLDYADLIRRD
jgi:5-methylcytosine-specific restriction endonuclease McrA